MRLIPMPSLIPVNAQRTRATRSKRGDAMHRQEPSRMSKMSKNRIEGAAKEVVGGAKQAVGKAVGDKSLETKGAIEKATGSAQKEVGKIQDKLGDAIKE